MSDPVRLLAGGASDFEQELLRAWATRQPSDEARARVVGIAGIGVAAGLMAASAASASSGLAPSVATAVTTASAAKVSFGSAIVLKWLAIGAVGVSFAVGAVGYILRSPMNPGPTPSAVHVPVISMTATSMTATSVTATPPVPTTAPAPIVATQTPETVPAAPARAYAPAARARETSTLDEEVATIERARRAIAAGDGATAIAVVDAYDTKYPGGSLAQESTEIRIDALLRQGDRTTAERLASRFIAAHPSSPYVRRLRALLANPH